jgi:hypothetical protein
MSRHGKSKSKSRRSKPRADKFVDEETLDEAPQRKAKASATKPQKRVVATETAGALPRENTVRQTPAPEPKQAKAAPAQKPQPAKVEAAKPAVAPAPIAPSELPAVESAVEIFQRSLQAARQGTVEVNRMLLDIGRSNFASGFEFAKTLAGVRTPMEAAKLQLAFFDERVRTLLQQAEELRALSAAHIEAANEPLRSHMRLGRIAAWWR